MKGIILVLFIILVSGCLRDNGYDDLRLFKGIAWGDVPDACIDYTDDVCGLFDCMVDLCWCAEVGPSGPILVEGGTAILTEQEAIDLVQKYVDSTNSEYDEVKRAVKLNNIFFNVFTYNSQGDEKSLTVAVDGSIIQTQCGV